MFIRMLSGRYAGEIRDVREEEAHGLLERGLAQDPYAPKPTLQPLAISPQAAAALQPARNFEAPRKKAKK